MDAQLNSMKTAGTGAMKTISDSIRELQVKGYTASFELCYDHISCGSGDIVIQPDEFFFDDVLRFENSSDPDDQSILYVISVLGTNLKGLCAESYGLYHNDISQSMINRLQECHAQRRITALS